MLFIYRNLESLLYPLGMAWAGLLIGTFVMLRKRRVKPALCFGGLCVALMLIGSTPLPEHLLARLEKPYRENTIANAPKADVVVVLGGFIDPSAHDAFGFTLNGAADRIVTGVELLRAGKSANLLIGGGPSITDGKPSSEGIDVEGWLRKWNVVPGAEVIGLPACQNTRQEAIELKRLMEERKWKSVILVTSASHMNRARATFRKHGIDPHPVACDFEALPAVENERANWRIVPIMDHLHSWNVCVHEAVGAIYYKLRGWI